MCRNDSFKLQERSYSWRKKKAWEVGCICNIGTLYPFKKKEKLKKICQNITIC